MKFLDVFADGSKYRQQVYDLYEEAFPEEEKKPIPLMEELTKIGKMEILAVEEEEEFAGLAINMLSEKTALLDYFAIAPHRRCNGSGGRAVRALEERFKNKKYIFEIEMQDEKAPNAEDRKRRKAFYLRNGLKETGIFANVYETDFELLTPDGELTFEEYLEILLYILGEEGTKLLNPHIIEKRIP